MMICSFAKIQLHVMFYSSLGNKQFDYHLNHITIKYNIPTNLKLKTLLTIDPNLQLDSQFWWQNLNIFWLEALDD